MNIPFEVFDPNVLDFMRQAVREKHGGEVTYDFIDQESKRLYREFGEHLVNHFMPLLKSKDIEEFDKLVRKGTSQEKLLNFVMKKIPNLAAEIENSIVAFRSEYLKALPSGAPSSQPISSEDSISSGIPVMHLENEELAGQPIRVKLRFKGTLTPQYMSQLLVPYLQALTDLQSIIGQLQGKEHSEALTVYQIQSEPGFDNDELHVSPPLLIGSNPDASNTATLFLAFLLSSIRYAGQSASFPGYTLPAGKEA
jgi:hypothetical protein